MSAFMRNQQNKQTTMVKGAFQLKEVSKTTTVTGIEKSRKCLKFDSNVKKAVIAVENLDRLIISTSRMDHIKTRCCNKACSNVHKIQFGELPNGNSEYCSFCCSPLQYMIGGKIFNKTVQYKKGANHINHMQWAGPVLMTNFMNSVILK